MHWKEFDETRPEGCPSFEKAFDRPAVLQASRGGRGWIVRESSTLVGAIKSAQGSVRAYDFAAAANLATGEILWKNW